jgi:phospholipase C
MKTESKWTAIMRFAICAIAAGIAMSGCGAGMSSLAPRSNDSPPEPVSSSSPITHVVLMIQENRTFNDFFATFPGVTGSKTGYELVKKGTKYVRKKIKLKMMDLERKDHGNLTHRYPSFLTAYDNGGMDGFNLVQFNGLPERTAPYQYVDPAQIVPYWFIASSWGIADAMFQTQGSESFTAHQDLIRGGTFIDSTHSLIDEPTSHVWGCDAAKGTHTTLITTDLTYQPNAGPYPCSNKFPDYGSGGYKTLADLIDAKHLSWKYYTPAFLKKQPNSLWNAFDVIAQVRYGPEWTDGHIASPETTIFTDITNGTLPAMSWVIPDAQNSDHPGFANHDTGPAWVASVVNAIGESSYWNSTAVIVVWDDWGGFYDPVAPPTPRDNQGGPGFRIPMLVISPYVAIGSGSNGGYVSHTVYSFGSILRFIEDTFGLGRLGTTDGSSTSMVDMFDFNQSPRYFQQIPSSFSREYFLHQKPSGLPVDTE